MSVESSTYSWYMDGSFVEAPMLLKGELPQGVDHMSGSFWLLPGFQLPDGWEWWCYAWQNVGSGEVIDNRNAVRVRPGDIDD